MAVSGNTAVVSAPGAGKVYIYTRGKAGWGGQPSTILNDPRGPGSDGFGESVAVSGSTVVVGATSPSVPVTRPGAVYVYTRGTAGWPTAPTATLPDPSGLRHGNDEYAFFGWSVAISGSSIVVGAPSYSGERQNPSAAYIYTAGTAGWPTAPTVTLPAPGAVKHDLFGWSTAISGTTVVISVPAHDRGAAYIYTAGTAGWSPAPSVTLANPRGPARYNSFGKSVAVAGGTLAVGSEHTPYGAGPAYIYTEGTAGWPARPTVTLQDPRLSNYDEFGSAVTVSGGITILGAFNAAPRKAGLAHGRAYVYASTAAGWPATPTVTLHHADVTGFGYSVDAHGSTAIISALNGAAAIGQVFIYSL